jgi:hypothetical protein
MEELQVILEVQEIQVLPVTEVTEVMVHLADFLTQETPVILAQGDLEAAHTLGLTKLEVTAPQVLPVLRVIPVMLVVLGFKVLLVYIPQTLQLPMVILL